MGKIRRMASEFQGQFQEAMREAEMADLKKQFDETTSRIKSFTDFDPIGSVRKDIESFTRRSAGAHSDARAGNRLARAAAPSHPRRRSRRSPTIPQPAGPSTRRRA